MLDRMELADLAYVETADRRPDVRGRRRIRWGSVAACLGLAAACGAFVFLCPNIEENPFTTENIQDISALSSAYGSTLLAENLVFSDAENTTVQLRRMGDGDISDASSWDTLSVTAKYVDCNVVLNCSFHTSEETGTLDPPSEVIPYGDFQVFLYREEPTEYFEYIYRALFEYKGIAYDLSTQSNDSQGIYDLLDIVTGVSPTIDAEEDSQPRPFADILGYENYRISVEESSPYFYIWRYYVETDGETQCVAHTFGYDDHPGAYSVDLDGDGITEFITNCEYGDGAEEVYINRIHDGVIEQGYLDERYLEENFYLSLLGPAASIAERYDPQENVFVVTGPSRYGGTLTITISYEEQEAFKFLPYNPLD